jgi:hypothetical protein
MACLFCGSNQSLGVTEVNRKISKGEFVFVNVPAMICENPSCNRVVIDKQVVKNMQLLRSKMIRGELPFKQRVEYQDIV